MRDQNSCYKKKYYIYKHIYKIKESIRYHLHYQERAVLFLVATLLLGDTISSRFSPSSSATELSHNCTFLLRDKEIENRFGRDGYGRRDNRSRSPLRERRTAGGFMNDARAAYSRRDGAYSRYDGVGDKTVWGQGGKEVYLGSRKIELALCTIWEAQADDMEGKGNVNNEEGIVSYVGTQPRSNGDVSVQIPHDVMVHDLHKWWEEDYKSNCDAMLPDDAQIIGALNGMEIAPKIQDETMIATETQDDDLLGEDLMEMECTVKEVEPVGDVSARVKPRKSSSHKSGGRSGFPFGIQNKKAGK
ncbi:LOW QUALITY PROTEIN: hypothetical protein HID58_024754 [Brassica napus]|uniref:Uncharacterized protein n=1 Tax=Brassica napus TaxID=3708 RepID=A0ABQ8CJ31_BRANA|nr:LOW QUALITY PROTEIN: hypothetical protein HID58_024754 [Brassica napus]